MSLSEPLPHSREGNWGAGGGAVIRAELEDHSIIQLHVSAAKIQILSDIQIRGYF